MRRRKWRILLWLAGVLCLAAAVWNGYTNLLEQIPDQIKVIEGEGQIPEFGPLLTSEIVTESKEVSARSFQKEEYVISCKLLGLLELKEVQVQVVDETYIVPGGIPIGIYLKTKGVLVVGTSPVQGVDGILYEPALDLVQEGDYILAVNGESISNKKELIGKVNACGKDPVVLDLRRENEQIQIKVNPVLYSPKEYKLGIWVRDNTQGIGTLTFIDGDRKFGALGHGINDVDTSGLMDLWEGTLYDTEILDIIKGTKGTPGEMSGVIHYKSSNEFGTITKNTSAGIFGEANSRLVQQLRQEPVQVCYKQNIRKGPAVIRSQVSGELRDYEVEIMDINNHGADVNKGIVLKVTDEELLAMTGGIVQGMSGSPILQDGKIIGAVTHVFVQDSTKGFGIFIENMLDNLEERERPSKAVEENR